MVLFFTLPHNTQKYYSRNDVTEITKYMTKVLNISDSVKTLEVEVADVLVTSIPEVVLIFQDKLQHGQSVEYPHQT